MNTFFSGFSTIMYITTEFNFAKKWIQKLNNYFADFKQVKKVGYFVNNTVFRPLLVTYPSVCSTCVTYGTLCHAIGRQLLPTHLFTTSATDLRKRFLLWGVFYLTLLPASFKASLGRQFNPKVSRALCWSSKHSPGPTICLNHSNPQKGL